MSGMISKLSTPPMAMPSGLTFRLIDDPRMLCGLERDWRALIDRSTHREPMQDPDWLLTWWHHYGRSRQLRAGLLYNGGDLIGFAPFCLRTHTYRPRLRFRRLEFMGANGSDTDAVWSEYQGLIAADGYEDLVTDEIGERIISGAFGEWDECLFDMMNGEGACPERLAGHFRRKNYPAELTPVETASYLTLPTDWDSYLASLKSKRRHWFKRNLQEFERWAGTGGYSIHAAVDQATLRTGLDILKTLHGERWHSQDHSGAFASPRFSAFHEDYMAKALTAGRLELLWLCVGDTPVGVIYSIAAGDRLIHYQSGRSTAVPSTVSIGIIMIIFALKHAMSRRYREFDFLGGHTGYKLRFTATTRPLVSVRVARPGMRETARLMVAALEKHARALRSRLRADATISDSRSKSNSDD